jgi:A/G-specific adenine glycosylase
VDIYDGVIPNDPILLKKLPWLGDYTAHSICAFAYNMDVPVMDINTKRIMLHWFWYDEKTTSDTDVRAMLMACLPRWRASDRYNALMDYGSQVLHARKTGIKSTPQSTFAWSRRQARWNILKYLINHGPTHISIVSDHVIFDDLSGVIDELIGEKMIVCEDGVVRLVW